MSTYTTGYQTLLVDNGDGTLSASGNSQNFMRIASDDPDNDGYFSDPETIHVTVSSGAVFEEDYFAHVEDGWISGNEGDSFYILYSMNPYTSGTLITPIFEPFAVCFLPATLIATPGGAVAIETLKAGDLVLTAEGEAKPVRWLARQTVHCFLADSLEVLPICIRAGALGEALPQRDLFVSPQHAVLVEGLLVQAGALVNGTTVTRLSGMPDSFVYYHVELEDHSLILAEGLPAETFVDNVTRRAFDNWQEAPEAPPVIEMALPRAKSWRQLPQRVRSLLAARAAAFGCPAEQQAA